MSERETPDVLIFAITLALLVVGLFLVSDASYALAVQEKKDSMFYLKCQLRNAIIGIVFLFLFMSLPVRHFKWIGCVLLGLSILGLTLVFRFEPVNGSFRWMEIFGIRLQPSEFAKLGLILFLAAWLGKKGREPRSFVYGLGPALLVLVLVAGLVVVEPDVGTAFVIVMVGISIMFFAGVRVERLVFGVPILIPLFIKFVHKHPYILERIVSFVNPFKYYDGPGYQVSQSLMALGSGNLFGVGLCEGREKMFYLPYPYTDFILSVLGEECGLLGTLLIVALFGTFAVKGFIIASRARTQFERLLSAGITSLICGQALLNMAVITSMVPPTGIPLPFISYGGSALVVNLSAVGILLSVSKRSGCLEHYGYQNRTNRGWDRRACISGYRTR